jgi:hypothetical protein
MPSRRLAEEPSPQRTARPLRQIVVYLCITYGLAVAGSRAQRVSVVPHHRRADPILTPRAASTVIETEQAGRLAPSQARRTV